MLAPIGEADGSVNLPPGDRETREGLRQRELICSQRGTLPHRVATFALISVADGIGRGMNSNPEYRSPQIRSGRRRRTPSSASSARSPPACCWLCRGVDDERGRRELCELSSYVCISCSSMPAVSPKVVAESSLAAADIAA